MKYNIQLAVFAKADIKQKMTTEAVFWARKIET